MRRMALLIAAAVALAGCTTLTPGAPANPPPTSPPLVPRPRELRLDGVDPCTLLTPAQRAPLGLREASEPFTSTTPMFRGPACSISGFEPRAIAVGFFLSLDNGLGAITRPGAITDELTPITIAGFPAVLARPHNPDFCSVDIDLADGQFLDVQFADGGRLPPIPQDQLCRDAPVVAEQAVRTLLAR